MGQADGVPAEFTGEGDGGGNSQSLNGPGASLIGSHEVAVSHLKLKLIKGLITQVPIPAPIVPAVYFGQAATLSVDLITYALCGQGRLFDRQCFEVPAELEVDLLSCRGFFLKRADVTASVLWPTDAALIAINRSAAVVAASGNLVDSRAVCL